MKVTLILKKSVTRYDTESQATIYARLRDGRQLDLVAPTRLTINPNLWDDKAEQVKSKVVCDEAMRTRYNNEARRLKTYIERAYQNRPEETVSKGWLKEALDQYYNPQKYNLEQVSAIKPTLTGPILQSAEVQPGASIRHQTDLDRAVRRVSREAPSFGGSQEELSRHQAGFTAL